MPCDCLLPYDFFTHWEVSFLRIYFVLLLLLSLYPFWDCPDWKPYHRQIILELWKARLFNFPFIYTFIYLFIFLILNSPWVWKSWRHHDLWWCHNLCTIFKHKFHICLYFANLSRGCMHISPHFIFVLAFFSLIPPTLPRQVTRNISSLMDAGHLSFFLYLKTVINCVYNWQNDWF